MLNTGATASKIEVFYHPNAIGMDEIIGTMSYVDALREVVIVKGNCTAGGR